MDRPSGLNGLIGVVVPTLGTRNDYLIQSLKSLREAGADVIIIVTPNIKELAQLATSGLVDKIFADPGTGLASAINQGIEAMANNVEYVSWLGDDDLLFPESLSISRSKLSTDNRLSFTFGWCEYMDQDGKSLWTNKSGVFAPALLGFGPDLIPQPGSLIRRSSWMQVGGLNEEYRFAFDLDLFLRLTRVGKSKYLNTHVSKFRWHPDSLSVKGRREAVQEASTIRISHLPKWLTLLSWLWEPSVRLLTLYAGKAMTKRASRLSA